MTLSPFHLAIAVRDLEASRRFYVDVLGCRTGRESQRWIDLDLFGHQLVVHLAPEAVSPQATNPVDGHDVPIPHFGVVLDMETWQALSEKLKQAGTTFVIEPYTRFEGRQEIGGQSK